ncbi:MAG: IS110 family transposase [Nitrospirota bacterium]|nr:MAG: IS110 family transposase [Nitrospirota bacterium]
MTYYCGIDLHSKDSWLCVIDEKDRIQQREKVPNHLPIILHALEKFSPKPSVVVESTMNWYWLVDGLQDAGFEVKLAHIFGLHMITGAKVKTDRRDAFSLARLLRLDAVPEAYIYPKTRRPLRDLLRRRNRLVSVRATAYQSMKQILLQQGIHGYSLADLKRFDEAMILTLFDHPALQAGMQMELERIRLYSREILTLERIIQKSVSEEPLFELLQTIPGVGKILGLTIFYEVGDVERFSGPKPFCSYARVVPGVAQSSSVTRRGRGSKQGNPYLKWAFMQAAGISVRYDPDVRKFRQTHMARRRSKARRLISLSIVAHKLAIGAYFVLKDRVPFKMELMFAK